ncbi:MAG: NUDIX domain-containing protein [Gaiellaceae bacterium]
MTRSDEVLVAIHRPEPSGTAFLVLRRAPFKQGYWHLAGGGVEAGETAAEAAVRELAEETGLAVSELDDLGADLGYDGVRVHAFAAGVPAGWEPTLNEEHDDYRWCTLDDALRLLVYEEPREVVRRTARGLGVHV